MELIKGNEKLIMFQLVGEATETLDSGDKVTYELATTMKYAPIVTLPNGDYIVFNWQDIINLAVKLQQKESTKNELSENKEKEEFNTNEDILYQIAMMSFIECNPTACEINEHMGDVYSNQDQQEHELYTANYEKKLLEQAVMQLQQEKQNLVKYLEDKLSYIKNYYSQVGGNYFNMNYTIDAYEDVLERVKSGNYGE